MVHLVTGLPGTGKSEVARLISEGLNALVINTDDLRDKLFPERRTTRHGDFTIYQIRTIYSTIRVLTYYLAITSPEKHFVLDGSFRYEHQRKSIIDEMKRINHPTRVVHVKADWKIVQKRIKCRRESDRHLATYATYRAVKRSYEKPLDCYEIDNSGSFADLKSRVKLYLASLD